MRRTPSWAGPARGVLRQAARASWWPALGLGILLVLYNNLVSLLPAQAQERYAWALVLGEMAALAVAVVWALRWAGLGRAEAGLAERRPLRNALLGAGLGSLVICPVVIYFLFPVGVPRGEIDYEGAAGMTLGGFLLWALVQQPLGTALFEEAMYRGLLQGLAVRAWGLSRGLLFVAGAFAVSHLVINHRTVQETAVGEAPALAIAAQVASLVGLAVGSLLMSVLRLRTGGLAAPVSFHWAVVVAMQATLFALSR